MVRCLITYLSRTPGYSTASRSYAVIRGDPPGLSGVNRDANYADLR
jgi:hypothetical protein